MTRGRIDMWQRKKQTVCADCGDPIPVGRKRCYECADIRYDQRAGGGRKKKQAPEQVNDAGDVSS